jgi:hypothetical protein
MKRILAALALLALPLAAQDAKQDLKPVTPNVQKLFVLKYAEPDQISNLVRTFGSVMTNTQMHALTVSTTPEAMAAIEDAIKRLDVPSAAPQNVELTAYLLIGSQAENASAAPLPKELDGVVTQLKNAFAYKNYSLMDVLSLRTRTQQQGGPTAASGGGGSVQIDNNLRQVNTDLRIRSVDVAADGTVRINSLTISSKVIGNNNLPAANINTDLDLKEGQKVVVGKTGLTPNAGLFVVMMAHVAQ